MISPRGCPGIPPNRSIWNERDLMADVQQLVSQDLRVHPSFFCLHTHVMEKHNISIMIEDLCVIVAGKTAYYLP